MMSPPSVVSKWIYPFASRLKNLLKRFAVEIACLLAVDPERFRFCVDCAKSTVTDNPGANTAFVRCLPPVPY